MLSQTIAEPGAYKHAVAVTPDDGADLPGGPCKGLYIGVAGNITVDMGSGSQTVLFTAVPIGVFPIVVQRVNASGTAASGIVALY